MTSRWVCTYCVMSVGIYGADLKNWPAYDDLEGQAQHLEAYHHIPVQRSSETSEECMERFKRENPEAGGPNCKCPRCIDSHRAVNP